MQARHNRSCSPGCMINLASIKKKIYGEPLFLIEEIVTSLTSLYKTVKKL